jgi:CelD/BcsL family acetyltransferase involved in cellulose biosynthesis
MIRARWFQPGDAEQWDDFCQDAPMATFLHRRRFLSYHGDRFEDRSLLIEDDGRLVGLLPAARGKPETLAVSHPGATYGGIVHCGRLRGERMLNAFTAILDAYRSAGFTRLRYKAVPGLYHRRPADDDLYALFRIGATRTRCDLSCAIDLASRGDVAERRRRAVRKAARSGVSVTVGAPDLPAFWTILERNLADRHQAKPAHSLAEITRLGALFPDEIRLVLARQDGTAIAGVLLFCTPTTCHAQYIASDAQGRSEGALDVVFEAAIAWAHEQQFRYFDFGISNEDEGRTLNTGLYEFKAEFGASGAVHEFYDIDL